MKQKKTREWKPEQIRMAKAIMVLAFLFFTLAAYLIFISMIEGKADAQQSEDGFIFPLKQFEKAFSTQYIKISREKEKDTHSNTKDTSLSPYFMVNSTSDETDRLPLKATSAEVTISGVIAEVNITQTYINEGANTLEATYIFPASTRASVFSMRMTIGKRVIEAEIKEKSQARKLYQQAIDKGQTASLLEQKRPNVFQMKVGNILPKDKILVELSYVEHLVPENNIYEFVFPTVVGPRYSESSNEENEGWVKNPYLHQGEDAPFTFDFALKLKSGLPISRISSPSHDLLVDYEENNIAHVFLDDTNKPCTRDVVLRYNLAGRKIESGVMLYEGDEENYFLMMMQPPKRVSTNEIVPREYIFILDVSGSMHGFPLDTAKQLMNKLLSELNAHDMFNIMFFAGGNRVLFEQSQPVNTTNIKKAIDLVNNSSGGGGTRLLPALKNAMALKRVKGMSRIAVVVTDGYVAIEKEAFEIIAENLNTTNVFAFGIGSSVNRFLIEGMARAGHGEPFVVLNQNEAKTKAEVFRKYISSPILQGIKVEFEGIDAYDIEPLVLPDMFADRPLVLFGKYKGKVEGRIIVSGNTVEGRYENQLEFTNALKSDDQNALKYLWARQRIMRLSDMNKLFNDDERIQEVTNLGLKYNLLTNYTSFVAVDKEIRAGGNIVKVKQPLPLPDGVSDMAVGEFIMAENRYTPATQSSLGGSGKRARYKANIGARGALGAALAEEESSVDKTTAKTTERKVGKPTESEAAKKKEAKVSYRTSLHEQNLKKLLDNLLEKQLPTIKQKYVSELKKGKNLSGVLKIKITIDVKGKIAEVRIIENTVKSETIEKLVKEKLMSLLYFPKPQNRNSFSITFIFRKS